MDTGHWLLKESVDLTDSYGFIYLITNNVTKRMYVGKKQCISNFKRKPLKGRKNKRKDTRESDWKSYTGSSSDLNADIEKIGKDNFTFEILQTCTSKWELSYYELVEQLARNVLFDDTYYNGFVGPKLGKAPKNARDKSISKKLVAISGRWA
jgi:hypothetical protein